MQTQITPAQKTSLINVAVLFGGRSVEHEISVITALQLIQAIDQTKYKVIPVYISQEGRWYSGDALLERSAYRNLSNLYNSTTEVTLLPVPGKGGLTRINDNSIISVDVYLPAFHGQYGEDGCIQGLFELADVAYTGSEVLSSALTMNKYLCKLALQAAGVPVLPAKVAYRAEAQKDISLVIREITAEEPFSRYPLFVKPCNLGSSVGVSRVNEEADLAPALAKVFRYDDTAIIEPCVDKLMEVNVSIREHPSKGIVASVVEIPFSSSGVLSYEDKYLRDGGKKSGPSAGMASLTRVIDPPDLAKEIKDRVRELGIKSFKLLGCSGVARLDFIIDLSTNELYFNELNSLPGSVSFYLWVKSHPSVLFTEELSDMIEMALIKKGRKDALDRDIGFKALK